jgi:FtsZ-binding cell division protein ZapB
MGKLKQYEIDAIVSLIQRQISEITEAKNEIRFSKANAEMKKLEAEIDELEKKAYTLKEARDKRGRELAGKLGKDVKYNDWGNEFIVIEKSDYSDIRDEVIINQLDLTSDVDTFIKKIIEKYSK